MIFTRQLATLIDAGLPLLRGLTVLSKQEPDPVLKKPLLALRIRSKEVELFRKPCLAIRASSTSFM
jgi:type II secretory pathway component PulF